jgi:hypothetical protein
VLLERGSIVPKATWRDASHHRTLLPIDVAGLIKSTWRSNQLEVAEQSSIVVPIEMDGDPKDTPSIRPIQGQQKGFIGVFEVSFVSPDEVKVVLREEECARRIGSPKRRTRELALLWPWKPVRVLLNGRYGSYSGQYYLLREYHLDFARTPYPII